MIRFASLLRLLGIFAAALTVAHCGDGGGGGGDNDNFDDSGSPPAGTFFGLLSAGGTIRLEVGSIEAIEFECDGQGIRESFSPPQPIDGHRSFDVRFTDGGRRFRVQGTFASNDAVAGTIDDQDDECDGTFTAARGNQPAPTVTPTSGGTPTSTPSSGHLTATPTTTPSNPGPTCTASCITPTGPDTPTPTSTACPVAVEVVGDAGDDKVLDSGWTGLAHNATVVSEGKLTFTLSDCGSPNRPCGVCSVGGPIQNVHADAGDINARRCNNDTSIKCTDNSACGSGQCLFFFGSPLPLSAGGISTCVTNQVTGTVTGTANIESGAFASTLNLTSRVYNQISVDQPCPICNDATLNDGVKGGTCSGGAKNGQACDGNGTSPVPSFGTTSLDCPPVGLISALTIPLDGSSGSETLTLSASSPSCAAVGAQTSKCFCPFTGTEPTRPNACLDDSLTMDVVESCAAISGSNKGRCSAGPIDRVCSPLETFRSCSSNAECTASGDTCVPVNRPCFLDNGVIGGQVEAEGEADPPTNGVSNPTFAALFCIPPVAQGAINTAGGLPGLGRLELPLVATEILTLP